MIFGEKGQTKVDQLNLFCSDVRFFLVFIFLLMNSLSESRRQNFVFIDVFTKMSKELKKEITTKANKW